MNKHVEKNKDESDGNGNIMLLENSFSFRLLIFQVRRREDDPCLQIFQNTSRELRKAGGFKTKLW
jgi:hypothetical protein